MSPLRCVLKGISFFFTLIITKAVRIMSEGLYVRSCAFWSYVSHENLTQKFYPFHDKFFYMRRVKKCGIWPRFSTPVVFKALWFQNGATYRKAKTCMRRSVDDCSKK